MEVADFFLKFFLIIVSAKLMAELFAHFGLPSVIGEVMAGVIIGPSLLGIIGAEPTLLLLAQIGILFLLFQVGMETDVTQLFAVGRQSIMVATTGVVLPFVIGYAASHYFFGFSSSASAFIGGTLVATSIGITLRVLKDLGHQRSHIAIVVLGAAVIDDVIGVVILAMLLEYTLIGKIDLISSVKVIGFVTLFLVAAPVMSRWFVSFAAKAAKVSKTPGILASIVVAFILILAVLADKVGAPEIIGAFAAGLAITRKSIFSTGKSRQSARDELVTKVENSMTPISDLFIPVFFVMVGVSINLKAIDFTSHQFWMFALSMTILAFISKGVSGLWVKGSPISKLAVGIAMVPRGEVGLIFARTGLKEGIFDDATYTSMVFVVALTTLVTPLLLKTVLKRHQNVTG